MDQYPDRQSGYQQQAGYYTSDARQYQQQGETRRQPAPQSSMRQSNQQQGDTRQTSPHGGRQYQQSGPPQYHQQQSTAYYSDQRGADPRMSRQAPPASMRRSQESRVSASGRSARPSARRGNSPGLLAGLFGRGRNRRNSNEAPPPPPPLQQQQQQQRPSYSGQQNDAQYQPDRPSPPLSITPPPPPLPLPQPPPEPAAPKRSMFSKFKAMMSFAPQRDHTSIPVPSPPASVTFVEGDVVGSTIADPAGEYQSAPVISPAAADDGTQQASFLQQQLLHQQPQRQLHMQQGVMQPSVLAAQPPPAGLLQGSVAPPNVQQLAGLQHQVQMHAPELQDLALYKQRLLMETRALEEAKRKNLYLDFKLNLMVDMMVARVLEFEGHAGPQQPPHSQAGVVRYADVNAPQHQRHWDAEPADVKAYNDYVQ